MLTHRSLSLASMVAGRASLAAVMIGALGRGRGSAAGT